jgi:hypothetical protein
LCPVSAEAGVALTPLALGIRLRLNPVMTAASTGAYRSRKVMIVAEPRL